MQDSGLSAVALGGDRAERIRQERAVLQRNVLGRPDRPPAGIDIPMERERCGCRRPLPNDVEVRALVTRGVSGDGWGLRFVRCGLNVRPSRMVGTADLARSGLQRRCGRFARPGVWLDPVVLAQSGVPGGPGTPALGALRLGPSRFGRSWSSRRCLAQSGRASGSGPACWRCWGHHVCDRPGVPCVPGTLVGWFPDLQDRVQRCEVGWRNSRRRWCWRCSTAAAGSGRVR